MGAGVGEGEGSGASLAAMRGGRRRKRQEKEIIFSKLGKKWRIQLVVVINSVRSP